MSKGFFKKLFTPAKFAITGDGGVSLTLTRSGSRYSITTPGGEEIATAKAGNAIFRHKMGATINGAPCGIEFSTSQLTARLTLGAQPAATLRRQWDGVLKELGRPHRCTLGFEPHTDERLRGAIIGIAVAIDMMILAERQASSS